MKLKNPIHTKTTGGFDAVVTDITNRSTDQLDGYVIFKNATQKNVRWDFHGICRDNLPEMNLDMRLDEHQILRQPLKRSASNS